MGKPLVARAVELYHQLDEGGKVIYRKVVGVPATACVRTLEAAFECYANKGGNMKILLEDMEADALA